MPAKRIGSRRCAADFRKSLLAGNGRRSKEENIEELDFDGIGRAVQLCSPPVLQKEGMQSSVGYDEDRK